MALTTGTDAHDAAPAELAARLLDEDRRRQDEVADHDAVRVLDDAELPGVGGDAMSLREVLAAGGASTAVVLFLLNIIDEFDRIVMIILGPDIKETFGLNNFGLALLNSVGAIAVFLGTIPLGMLADRRRRTTLLGITSMMWGVFALLGGLARGAWQLGATRIVNGLGKGQGPVINSLIADRYPIEGRARIFALHTMANPVGNTIGPLLVAGIAAAAGGTQGWRWSLVILGFPAIAVALAAFTLREPPRGANEKAALGWDADALQSDPIPMAAGFERLRKIKTFAAVMGALAVLGFAVSGAPQLLNIFLEDHFDLDGVGRGVVGSLSAVGGVLGAAIGGPAADRLFRRDPAKLPRLIGATIGVFGILFVAGLYMPEVWMLVAFEFVALALVSSNIAGLSAIVAAVVPYRMRGFAFAIMGINLVLVGGLIGGVFTAVLADAVGERTALSVALPIGCLGVAGYLFAAGRHMKQDMSFVVDELRREREEADRVRAGIGADELLQVRNVDFSYGQVQVLFDVDLLVRRGETLAVLGTNGAGKSTLLRVISGLALPDRGVVRFDGRTITYTEPGLRVSRGIVQVPGGKAVFPSLTVGENLLAGAYSFRGDPARVERKAGEVLDLFPVLVPLLEQPAGTLSGGEQQLLALAKALLLEPQLLLIDELSLGLAPVAVQEILATVDRLHEAGITMIIVEQSINVALAVADRAVFMEKGRVRFEGPAADLLERHDLVRAVFLGGEGG